MKFGPYVARRFLCRVGFVNAAKYVHQIGLDVLLTVLKTEENKDILFVMLDYFLKRCNMGKNSE